ncbi:TetR/AcrR family transcriptional regulator [Nocardia alni]|uniref:TetR/AcrR family transcriptional regulator n=1 Tax=Nocardia alni TaxID=2815723 RepID=UPI0027E1BE6B|nr:TetR/AcrR family transcriptional regulator [Nocardia alni]
MAGRDGGAKRVRLSPEERRHQLITLGTRMLRERALEDISIGEIAAQAGISRGLLFHYFSSKQEFQLAIVANANAELLARTAPDRSLMLGAMLHDAVHRYVEYVAENRTSYLALLRRPAGTELMALVDATRAAMAERILAELPLPADDPDRPRLALAVRGWIAFVEEVTLSWLTTETVTREQLIDMLVDSLPGLAAHPTLSAALGR